MRALFEGKVYFLKFLCAGLLSGTSANQAFAMVSLSNGQFYKKYTDLDLKTKGQNFQLWRAYNSSHSQVGLFGRGWCSNLEFKLRRASTSSYEIYLCSQKKHHLTRQSLGNYTSKNLKLRKIGGLFTFFENEKPRMVFNRIGDLVKIYESDGAGRSVKVVWGESSIQVLQRPLNLQLRLQGEKVLSVNNKGKILSRYRYNGDLLVYSVDSKNQSVRYEYAGNRLAKIFQDEGQFFKIKYDAKGLVTRVDKAKNCFESFRYSLVQPRKARIEVSAACGKTEAIEKKYELTFDSKGQILRYDDLLKQKSIAYHETNYKPIVEVDRQGLKNMSYDTMGRLSVFNYQSRFKKFQSKIQYNSRGKIEKISYAGSKRPPRVVLFDYDKSGKRLKAVRSPKEIYFRLFYSNGILARIESKNSELSYNYGKSRALASVQLLRGKSKFRHDLSSKGSSAHATEIGSFLDSLYENMGELYEHSKILRGVLP